MSNKSEKRSKPDHQNSPLQETTNSELAAMITGLQTSMQAQFTGFATELRLELGKHLEAIKQDITKVNSRVSQVSIEVNSNTRAVARTLLSNDLVVSGIPYALNEDLANYFRIWCRALGYVDTSIPLADVRRLARQPIRDGSTSLLLIQFAITNQRNDFFGRYLRMRSLTLTHIGFQSNQRIFINENLIPSARRLKSKAVELKREKKLTHVYSRGGVIYVKLPDSDQDCPVDSEEELLRIVGELQE